jgi:hypothetical protein
MPKKSKIHVLVYEKKNKYDCCKQQVQMLQAALNFVTFAYATKHVI